MSRLIWIYVVCKSLLLSPVAMKELKVKKIYKLHYSEVREDVLRPPYGTNASCSEDRLYKEVLESNERTHKTKNS